MAPRNRCVYFGHGISVDEINATFVFLFLLFSVSLAAPASGTPEPTAFVTSHRGFRIRRRAPFKVRIDIKMPSVYIAIMIKTQIQLPDCLYREARRVAREREMSLAEVMRRGVEYITRVYPPLISSHERAWHIPKAVHTQLRQGVTLEVLRNNGDSLKMPL